MIYEYLGKLSPSTVGFVAERSKDLNRMARKGFNKILSTCSTWEIKVVIQFVFLKLFRVSFQLLKNISFCFTFFSTAYLVKVIVKFPLPNWPLSNKWLKWVKWKVELLDNTLSFTNWSVIWDSIGKSFRIVSWCLYFILFIIQERFMSIFWLFICL